MRLLDLIAQANDELSGAVGVFDYAAGVPFDTFAAWRIENRLQEYIRQCGGDDENISLNEANLEEVKRVSEQITIAKGRAPSERELAQAMGLDIEELRRRFEQV